MIKFKKNIRKEKKRKRFMAEYVYKIKGTIENEVVIEFDYLRVDIMRKG